MSKLRVQMSRNLLYNIRHFLQYIRARGFRVRVIDNIHGIFEIGHSERALTAVEDVFHHEDVALIQSKDGNIVEIID